MRVGVEGSEEMLELSKRVKLWASLYPSVMKRVIRKGLNVLAKEVRRRLRANLHKRSGKLFSSVRSRVVMKGKYVVDGEVFPRGSLERMIATSHEKGKTRHVPGGQPYMIVAGGRRARLSGGPAGNMRFISRLAPAASWLPKTKPSVSILPPRPSFGPALAAKRPEILEEMRLQLMAAYKKSKRGAVAGLLK